MKKPLAYKYRELVTLLSKLNSSARKKLIAQFKKPHIHCLSEIFKNFLKNRLPVKQKSISKLKKYRDTLHSLACKKPSISNKKRILLTRRGGSILGILLPIAASLISRLFNK